MAKAVAKTYTPEPVIEGYVLELTVEEAETLRIILGQFHCSGLPEAMYSTLVSAGVKRDTSRAIYSWSPGDADRPINDTLIIKEAKNG